ncbi:MAG: DUF4091 domain-containing protein [Clostridia bacterium]|nr:DUF4091 domain-containing protein [Clostridia bacterium]
MLLVFVLVATSACTKQPANPSGTAPVTDSATDNSTEKTTGGANGTPSPGGETEESATPGDTDDPSRTALPEDTENPSEGATGNETDNAGSASEKPEGTDKPTGTPSGTDRPTETPSGTDRPTQTATQTSAQTPTPGPTGTVYNEPANVCRSWDKDTLKAFTSKTSKESSVSLTSEGVKIAFTGPAGAADPFVYFDLEKYSSVTGKASVAGTEGAYLVFKIKCKGGDGVFEVFTHRPAAGDSAMSGYHPDGNWTYVLVDMTKTTLTKPEKLTSFRIDWSSINTAAGAEMVISEIHFYSEYNKAMNAAGLAKYVLKDSSGLSDNDPLASKTLTAPNEDASVKIWFEHVTEKVLRTVTTPGSRTGYTVRMAKNETENAQFIVAPGRDMDVRIEVDEFKDASGNTVPFELTYQYYHNIRGKFIPDALMPYSGAVSVKAGNSQGFVIRLTTSANTKAGTYNSIVHVFDNATGKEVKRAPVAVKVWNFALSDNTELRTSFALWPSYLKSSYNPDKYTVEQLNSLEDHYFEYFLKYRINIMDMPHGLTSSYGARFIDDPRVNTSRWRNLDMSVTEDNGGVRPSWMNKVIYYTVDEPQNETALKQLIADAAKIRANTPDYRMVCPIDRNMNLTASGAVTSTLKPDGMDQIEFMTKATNIWCVKMDAFTPRQLMFVNGASSLQSTAQDMRYGLFTERMKQYVAKGDELWAYIAINPTEPYVNWQMESDGTEAIISIWQMKQQNVTGLLYWAIDYWKVNYWGSEPWTGQGFGDGMLCYSGYIIDTLDPIPAMRLELIRDGIEDYQMLCMLEKKLGKDALNDILNRVTTSVVTYTNDDNLLHAVRVLLGDTLEK